MNERARRDKNAKAIRPIDRQECSHPHKLAFATKAKAKEFLRRSSLRQGEMHAYKCPCGLYHIGHRSPKPVVPAPPLTHGRGCACTPCRAEDWDAVDARLADALPFPRGGI